jgi:hypothetical protein
MKGATVLQHKNRNVRAALWQLLNDSLIASLYVRFPFVLFVLA